MQNYHKHTHESNIFTADSAVTIEDYAKRCIELGHKVLSSCEHGFQGKYYDVYDVAKKYNLKFIFGTEAYWVKDRFSKDSTNGHITIFARNENGRKEINRILSDANIEGYYYKPRLDLELLLSLTPENVFLTSACIAFWKYEDIEDIVITLHNHFKQNFMLEVQYHLTKDQQIINQKILDLSQQYNIKIIMGCDSHYIYPQQKEDREAVLEARGIQYENEDGWFMDYPDEETAFNRFYQQGILTKEQIHEAMNNTDIFRI
jgi:DNA polymerase III alpha subunit